MPNASMSKLQIVDRSFLASSLCSRPKKKVAVPVFEYLGTATAPSRNKALEQTSAYPTMRKRMTQEQ